MVGFPFGALIGAGLGLYQQQQQKQLSKDFAKKGIQWKVADAKAAGIHPLAALGATTHPAPVSPLIGDSVGDGIQRSVDAASPASTLRTRLENERLAAETELLRARSRSVIADGRRFGQTTTIPPTDSADTMLWGNRVYRNPMHSPAQRLEDEHGNWVSDPIGLVEFLRRSIVDRAGYGPQDRLMWDAMAVHRRSRRR